MTVASDIDPLTLALQPPPDETPEAREARLQRERDAKKRSDLIDEELNRQRNAEKSVRSVKILLLGQSESGKSTTLKNFQLINSPKAFKAERASWRAVVHLNVVRSIHLILDALTAAEAFASCPRPYSPDDPVYPPLTSELLALKMRLIPLQQVEVALLSKLFPHASPKNEAPDEVSSAAEVSVHSATPWKNAFSRLVNNVRGSLDGLEANEPQESREARQILHASSDYMIRLWNDPVVKEILKAHRLRLEDMAGFFLDAIQRVTALSYEPTDDDILRARLKTLGVSEHQFSLKTGNMVPHNWIVYDVGGARSLVRVPYFDHMHAIIFLAPVSCFDQVLAEDDRVNRLEDSMILWKIIVSSPLLKNANLILFLNKCDILKTKLASGIKLSDYVTSYGDRPNDFENCSQYLKKKFAGIVKNYSPTSRAYYTYFTSVIDLQSTSDILGSVQDTIIRQSLGKNMLL
ncbi:guanine nucleotide binding protein, alpha subunit [Mycena metata]|uniref:Guanine nucleotide binding protein, alpha subunit n=1 Tax=Mycena metata TaxID=1033252 RepID=A0AAD7I5P1_9AGAR|nr:guanine nucleotide binding protein, alpha subunit [Mycena metata]